MAARTRKSPKVVWLPPDRNNRFAIAPAAATTGADPAPFVIETQTTTGIINSEVVELLPLVGDAPMASALAGSTVTSLADFEGSSYRLRRIVGKVFVAIRQIPLAETVDVEVSSQLVTCGIIVLRVDSAGAPLLPASSYSPLQLDSARDPWVWKRQWALTNTALALTSIDGNQRRSLFPDSNCEYGSVMDGPHVDQKTARIISNEERLFFVCSTANMFETNAQGFGSAVRIWGDLRVLASMRSNQGNRRNASR